MEIKDGAITILPIKDLVQNEGQIEGVPANPRFIRDADYEKLKTSLQKDNLTGVLPLKVYAAGGKYIVLGGNMRYRALQELGTTEVACIILPKTDSKTLRKIVQLDNATFGNWDYDMLANEWDTEELDEWGVDVPAYEALDESAVAGLFEDAGETHNNGQQNIVIIVPTEHDEDIEDMKELVRNALIGYNGVIVK